MKYVPICVSFGTFQPQKPGKSSLSNMTFGLKDTPILSIPPAL